MSTAARTKYPFDLNAYLSVRDSVEKDLGERYPEQASAPWIRKEASRYAREFVPFLLPDKRPVIDHGEPER